MSKKLKLEVIEVPAGLVGGWYKLTADVKNPTPDRRSDSVVNLPVWKEGVTVYVDVGEKGTRGTVQWPDGTKSYYGPHDPEYPTFCQANGVLHHLVPVPLNLGMFLKKSWTDCEGLLIALIEYKGLSLDTLAELDRHMSDMDEDKHNALMKKHGGFYAD